MSPSQKVALTVLKKLYIQRGYGRRESALSRGLDPAHKAHVSKVLKVIRSEDLAIQTRLASYTVYLPTRGTEIASGASCRRRPYRRIH